MSGLLKSLIAFITALFTLASVAVVPGKPTENSQTLTDTITVMSFNVYIMGTGKKSPDNRANEVAEQIRRVSPDSFGLQEADSKWLSRISNALPEYAYVAESRSSDEDGETTAVFYLKDKYEVAQTNTFWLSPTPEKLSRGWDAFYERTCTYALLRNRTTGFTYAHFNCHLDHLGSISRYKSTQLITNRVAKLGYAAVLTGDFNAAEGGKAYKAVINGGMTDVKSIATVSSSGGTYHGYASLDTTVRKKAIDFIFVTPGTTAESYTIHKEKINGIYASDHFAISSVVTLTGPTETDGDFYDGINSIVASPC